MKKVLIVLGIVVVVLLAVGFALPTEYEIEESIVIRATPARIHAWVGDLEQWPAWIPWTEEDPTIVTTYGDKTSGPGASQSWSGKDGDGELTFTACDPSTGIAYDMAFILGDTRAPARSAMTYETNGDETTVVWTMEGDVDDFMPPVVSGYMTPVLKMSIRGAFERGLEKLKTAVESGG